eukprot:scaffold23573_cov62-Phaeocystis_antarctica.AAC.2
MASTQGGRSTVAASTHGTPRATCTRVTLWRERSTAAASTPPPSVASSRVSGYYSNSNPNPTLTQP